MGPLRLTHCLQADLKTETYPVISVLGGGHAWTVFLNVAEMSLFWASLGYRLG